MVSKVAMKRNQGRKKERIFSNNTGTLIDALSKGIILKVQKIKNTMNTGVKVRTEEFSIFNKNNPRMSNTKLYCYSYIVKD